MATTQAAAMVKGERRTSEGERPSGHESRSSNAGSSSPAAAIPRLFSAVSIATELPTVRRNYRVGVGLNFFTSNIFINRASILVFNKI